MARLKEGSTRTYTIPLRKGFLKAPKWRRSKRAVSEVRNFLIKHTKTEDIKIGRWLNEEIWKHGGKNPPGKVKVEIKKEKDFVTAELVELSPRAKRLMEAEAKKEAEDKKAELPEKKAEEKPTKKKAPSKKAKEEKKASRKDLQKELEEAKAAEEKRKTKKSKTTPTRQQELKMSKK